MNLEFCIPQREESNERFENNAAINEIIAVAFQESIEKFMLESDIKIKDIVATYRVIPWARNYEMIGGGKSRLDKYGSAVFCLWQGLYTRNVEVLIGELVSELTRKKYDSKTWHVIFDHMGLRRATSIDEIFDTLKCRRLVTLLVKNSIYPNSKMGKGNNFVSLVGIKNSKFLVDDSKAGRVAVDIKTMLQATEVAWIW